MAALRETLRRMWIAPIGLALAAGLIIIQWFQNLSQPLANVAIEILNRIGPHASNSYFQIIPLPPLGWKFLVWNSCATIAVLLVLWLVALWFYPETDQFERR